MLIKLNICKLIISLSVVLTVCSHRWRSFVQLPQHHAKWLSRDFPPNQRPLFCHSPSHFGLFSTSKTLTEMCWNNIFILLQYYHMYWITHCAITLENNHFICCIILSHTLNKLINIEILLSILFFLIVVQLYFRVLFFSPRISLVT